MKKFIERATRYPLEHGMLTVYESNTPSKDIKFYFEKNVFTIMTKGQKSVVANNERYEFFPGSFLIPEKNIVHSVSIPIASFDNPTQCLELEIHPSFIKEYYNELYYSKEYASVLKTVKDPESKKFYLSNDAMLIDTFIRIYKRRMLEDTLANRMLITLMLKEILLIIFQSDGLFLMLENTQDSIKDKAIQHSINYIKSHLDQKITVQKLAEVASMGNTTFFKRFKEVTSLSPVDYILKKRIEHAKILITKNQIPLKEVAFKSGFNSYEYFCSIFKKLENQKPNAFKKEIIQKKILEK